MSSNVTILYLILSYLEYRVHMGLYIINLDSSGGSSVSQTKLPQLIQSNFIG